MDRSLASLLMNRSPHRFAWLAVLLLSLVLWSGCATTDTAIGNTAGNQLVPSPTPTDVLREGDLVSLVFSGVPVPPERREERIKDDGTITLYLVGAIQVVGKTAGQLQKEIHAAYVPKYYVRLDVSVLAEGRFFYVDGSVKIPSRQPHQGELTVLKAIAAAGGFTDFANKKKVLVVRANGQKVTVDCIKALKDTKLDVPIFPGDKITVPQRLI